MKATAQDTQASAFPQFTLEGQVALVTGAARGLGRTIALSLANAGADVALGLRDVETAGSLADEIEQMGRRAVALQMDVTQLGELAPAVDEMVARLGRLDILVHNAGLGHRIAGLHHVGEPVDVAGAVVFLASPAASLITGETIMIDGGWTAR